MILTHLRNSKILCFIFVFDFVRKTRIQFKFTRKPNTMEKEHSSVRYISTGFPIFRQFDQSSTYTSAIYHRSKVATKGNDRGYGSPSQET